MALQVDGSGAAPEATDRLGRSGADVTMVSVYRWVLPADRRPALRLAEPSWPAGFMPSRSPPGPRLLNWFQIAADEGIDGPLRQVLAQGSVSPDASARFAPTPPWPKAWTAVSS